MGGLLWASTAAAVARRIAVLANMVEVWLGGAVKTVLGMSEDKLTRVQSEKRGRVAFYWAVRVLVCERAGRACLPSANLGFAAENKAKAA